MRCDAPAGRVRAVGLALPAVAWACTLQASSDLQSVRGSVSVNQACQVAQVRHVAAQSTLGECTRPQPSCCGSWWLALANTAGHIPVRPAPERVVGWAVRPGKRPRWRGPVRGRSCPEPDPGHVHRGAPGWGQTADAARSPRRRPNRTPRRDNALAAPARTGTPTWRCSGRKGIWPLRGFSCPLHGT